MKSTTEADFELIFVIRKFRSTTRSRLRFQHDLWCVVSVFHYCRTGSGLLCDVCPSLVSHIRIISKHKWCFVVPNNVGTRMYCVDRSLPGSDHSEIHSKRKCNPRQSVYWSFVALWIDVHRLLGGVG